MVLSINKKIKRWIRNIEGWWNRDSWWVNILILFVILGITSIAITTVSVFWGPVYSISGELITPPYLFLDMYDTIGIILISFFLMEIYSIYSDPWVIRGKLGEMITKKIFSFFLFFSTIWSIFHISKWIILQLTREFVITIIILTSITTLTLLLGLIYIKLNLWLRDKINSKK